MATEPGEVRTKKEAQNQDRRYCVQVDVTASHPQKETVELCLTATVKTDALAAAPC